MLLRLFAALAGVFAAILFQAWLHGGLAGVGLGLIGGTFALVFVLLFIGIHLAQPKATGHRVASAVPARVRRRRRLALIVVLAVPMTYAYLLLLVRGFCPDCAAWWAGIFAPALESIMPSAEVMRIAWALAGNEGIGLVNAHVLGFAMLWGTALLMFAAFFLTGAAYRHARAERPQEPGEEQAMAGVRWWHGIVLLAPFGYGAFGLWSGVGEVDDAGAFRTRGRGLVLQFNALALVFFAQIVWLGLAMIPVAMAGSLGRRARLRRGTVGAPSNLGHSG